jgi:hypothetical protein
MAAVTMFGAVAPAIAGANIPPKYHGEWCKVGRSKIDRQFKLCRMGGDPNQKITITAQSSGQCKVVADMPYYEGPADPTRARDTETWVAHVKCPDAKGTGFTDHVLKFWRTDNNGPILTTTREPGLVMRDISITDLGRRMIDEARHYKNPYDEPPP